MDDDVAEGSVAVVAVYEGGGLALGFRSFTLNTHQVTLVEDEDEVLVAKVLPYVLLEEEAPRSHWIPCIENLQAARGAGGAISISQKKARRKVNEECEMWECPLLGMT